uniref:Uncharacterized protein n=1 Tax=Aegilops tauschii subsp. strangulata TaxID=200361 RepID=A0A453JWT6_AEGTS
KVGLMLWLLNLPAFTYASKSLLANAVQFSIHLMLACNPNSSCRSAMLMTATSALLATRTSGSYMASRLSREKIVGSIC